MFKKLRLIFFLLLIPVVVWAGSSNFVNIAFVAPDTGCTPVTRVSNPDTGGTTNTFDTRSRGQSWTTEATPEDLYSITISINSDDMEEGDSGTLELRVGTSSDLTTYQVAKSETISDGTTGEVEFVFDSAYTMPASTTLYWAVMWSLADNDEVHLDRADPGSYSGGQYHYGPSSWSMIAGGATIDMYFKVKVCE